jgi:uncharacterized membrane-anchored protein YitT (DUF2179 family)
MSKKKAVLDYIIMAVGAVVAAIGVKFFLVPNNIAPAGFTGIASIIHALYNPLPIGTLYLLLNAPFFYLGLRVNGKRFILRTLFAMILYSVATDYIEIPSVTNDMLLASIYGGIIGGIGFGLILRFGGSTGGTDTLAKILTKNTLHLSVGMTMFIIDVVVVVSSAFVFGLVSSLYAIVTLSITDKVIDMVSNGLAVSRAFMVISEKSDEIAEAVMNRVERGITAFYARGAFSHTDKTVLLCVVSGNSEAVALKKIVYDIDEHAFIISWHANEVMGYGFKNSKGDS